MRAEAGGDPFDNARSWYCGDMRKLGAAISLAALVGSFGAIPAFAAETDEISATLLDEALSLYGAEVGEGSLAAELEASLVVAVDSGVVDEEIVASTSELIDAGAETSRLADDLLANQQEQESEWEDESDVVRSAFATVAQLFDECRDEVGACQLDYSNQFRAAWVTSETERLIELEAQVDSLTGEAKVRAEERLAARVEKLDAVVAGTSPNTNRGNSESAPGQVKKSSQSSQSSDQSSQSNDAPAESDSPAPAEPAPAQETPSPGKSESKGNSSNPGKGNGKRGE